jgi:erythromycin esterase-like protein
VPRSYLAQVDRHLADLLAADACAAAAVGDDSGRTDGIDGIDSGCAKHGNVEIETDDNVLRVQVARQR